MSVLNQRTAPKEVNFSLLCRSTQIQSIKIPAKLQDPMGRVEVIDSSEKLVDSRMHGKTTLFLAQVRLCGIADLLDMSRPDWFAAGALKRAESPSTQGESSIELVISRRGTNDERTHRV